MREHGCPREEAEVLERELSPVSLMAVCSLWHPSTPGPPLEGEPLLAWGLGVRWGDLLG